MIWEEIALVKQYEVGVGVLGYVDGDYLSEVISFIASVDVGDCEVVALSCWNIDGEVNVKIVDFIRKQEDFDGRVWRVVKNELIILVTGGVFLRNDFIERVAGRGEYFISQVIRSHDA